MSWPPGAYTCFGWLNEDGDIVNDDGDGDDDDFGDVLHVVCHPKSPHALDESGCWTSSFLEEVDLINLITAKQIVFITIVIVRIALNFLTMIIVTILFHFRHLYSYMYCVSLFQPPYEIPFSALVLSKQSRIQEFLKLILTLVIKELINVKSFSK